MSDSELHRNSDNRFNQASQLTASLSHKAAYLAKYRKEKI